MSATSRDEACGAGLVVGRLPKCTTPGSMQSSYGCAMFTVGPHLQFQLPGFAVFAKPDLQKWCNSICVWHACHCGNDGLARDRCCSVV